MKIKPQIKQLLVELNTGVFEKEEVTALTLLTAIAGESIFLLGAPGVAKSLIARRLKFAFDGGSSFEYLMNRFSTPDEIFGPVSISKLKDEDKYERIVKNYLPTATVVFLDEIWKAGPSIQNSLLTVLNEKVYRNGDTEIHLPMKALIAASNELPMEGEGLEALWDRFLVRYLVGGIEGKNNFNEMISKSLKSYEDNITLDNKISNEKYISISESIDGVIIPADIFNIIHIIRKHIEGYNKTEQEKKGGGTTIYISDRRWKKIIRLLRASAFLNDRAQVDIIDCFLITHCIWHEAEQIKPVAEIVKAVIQKYGYSLNLNLADVRDELVEFNSDVLNGCIFKKDIKYRESEVHYDKYYKIDNAEFSVSFNGSFDLISITDFNKISTEPLSFNVHCDTGNSTKGEKPKKYLISKAPEANTIIYEGKKYKVKMTISTREETFTKKPSPENIDKWLHRSKTIHTTTSELINQIDKFRNKDLPDFKTNLFVNASHAVAVEQNWAGTENEIEIMEVEANKTLLGKH